MKKLILMLAAFFGFSSAAQCQSTIDNAVMSQSGDTVHVMLRPDSNTMFMDELGQSINRQQFMTAMKSGEYSFSRILGNGRIKNMKLKWQANMLSIGKPAPQFSLTAMDGTHYDLKNLKGKTIFINFWLTSSPSCKLEIPQLNGLSEKYKDDKNVVFLGVTYDPAKKVKAFLLGEQFEFNIIPDQKNLANCYDITDYPSNLIIDNAGNIVFISNAENKTNVELIDNMLQSLEHHG